MAIFLHNNVIKSLFKSPIKYFLRFSSLFTPDYLSLLKPKIPLYGMVNVQIKGYNYPTLENFQRLIHQHAVQLDIDIENSFATPSKSLKIQRLKDVNTGLQIDYQLEVYERNVLVSDVSSIRLPMFIRLLESTLPEGVTLKVQPWDSTIENKRYIPDKELIEAKTELENMRKK
ncbi:Similar to Mrpl48: 39S ribosomal protein L48 [Cotesia congregata]|uniref:Mitochondrial (Mus musculus) n=1 Tax=Cotesia congregata TaxID=51543 RepID=A0A8J2HJH2_COTCN|nr:Similar to Mrpl48: 39S ribosomal protein L48 [Cotesia congregata]